MTMFTDTTRDLVVITTETSWDEPPRMRHYVAQQLSRFYNVLYCELFTTGKQSRRVISDSLIVLRVGGFVRGMHRSVVTKSLNEKLQTRTIVAQAKKFNAPACTILNFRFDYWHIYTNKFFDKRCFFLNDDFVNMDPNASDKVKQSKQKLQDKVVKLCDHVFTSSQPLADDVQGLAKSVSVICSGHDFKKEQNLPKKTNAKTNVCFMGYIQGNLENAWIDALAKQDNVEITFVGPVQHQPTYDTFNIYENVTFKGPLTGSELQSYLSEHDVFIMPYTMELANTKATVPAKLYQYLACGRPVVSNPLPNLVSLPDKFVYQAKDAEEFVELVLTAKREDTESLYEQRILLANEQHWDSRGSELLATLQAVASAN